MVFSDDELNSRQYGPELPSAFYTSKQAKIQQGERPKEFVDRIKRLSIEDDEIAF